MEVINIVTNDISETNNMAMTRVNTKAISTRKKKKPMDIGLLVTIFILLSLGLIMVLSASAPSALTYEGDSYHYFRSQLTHALVGIGAMFFFSLFDYRIFKGKLADIGIIASIVLLILVLIPGVRTYYKGCDQMDKYRISVSTVRGNENSTYSLFSSKTFKRSKEK